MASVRGYCRLTADTDGGSRSVFHRRLADCDPG